MVLIMIIFGFLMIVFILVLTYRGSKIKIPCEYLLVLGAKIIDKDTPCKILESRLLKAIEYLNDIEMSKVIVSGGISNEFHVSEADVMKKFLIKHGIESGRIIVEDKAINTFQNLKFAKHILKDVDEILIVSTKYHLFRTWILSKRAGFKKVYFIGSDVDKHLKIKNILREVVAVIKSIFLDW